MKTPTTRRLRAIVVGLAALCLGAPAPVAGAAGLDPAIYDPGVPAGQVEHGVVSFTITGSPKPEDWRIEYWITAGRWREQTTDATTGALVSGRVHYDGTTAWVQYDPANGDPLVLRFHGDDTVPGPGDPAPFNRKLIATGVKEGSDQHPIMVTLQPIGPQVIAGFAGTAYEELSNGQTGLGTTGDSAPAIQVTIVLQDGTYQPLMREFTIANRSYGPFVQREVLLSRETTSTSLAGARLTRSALARTVARWKVKVANAVAKKKRHKK